MTPNYEAAAIKATETLLFHAISAAPVDPLPILKAMPGVLVVSFAEMAEQLSIDRKKAVQLFGAENQDAYTAVKKMNGRFLYLVAYNQRLPFYMLQRGLARELGHIVLGHDGTRPEDVRVAEAVCFAHHFLCPRPLIKAVQDSGIPFTVEVLGNMTGCYEHCLSGMRRTPAVHVPAEMNRMIKSQFEAYLENFLDFQAIISKEDTSALADFGTYMDGYEE